MENMNEQLLIIKKRMEKETTIYDEIKNNINTFETIIEAYDYFDYVPKEIVKTILMHLGKVIEDNSDVFNTDHRQ